MARVTDPRGRRLSVAQAATLRRVLMDREQGRVIDLPPGARELVCGRAETKKTYEHHLRMTWE
jgi:hypothetical protein